MFVINKHNIHSWKVRWVTVLFVILHSIMNVFLKFILHDKHDTRSHMGIKRDFFF